MATLKLHSPRWQWVDSADEADWWVVDGTVARHDDLLPVFAQAPRPVNVAYLAHSFNDMPCKGWTFFKVPVESALLFNWVIGHLPHIHARASAQPAAAPDPTAADEMPWRYQEFRLRRWPNMARYGGGLELTVACSKALVAYIRYDDLISWGVAPDAADRMLADAMASDLLDVRDMSASSAAPAALVPAALPASRRIENSPTPTDAGTEPSRWDLVKRLLKRFAR